MRPYARAPRSTAAVAGWRLAHAAVVLLLVGVGLAACGKKGPPLAPLVRTPARLSDFTVRRSGDTVYLRLTVPDANNDHTTPADLSRIEVYAYTAVKEIDGLGLRDMALVAQVLVRRPRDPDEDPGTGDTPVATRKLKQEKPPEPGVDQGSIVTITDVLTPQSKTLTPIPRRLVPKPLATIDGPSHGSPLELPAVGPVLEARPRRFYVAYAVSRSGLRGSPAPRFAVAFDAPPLPPGKPRFEVKEKTLEVTWDPPSGAAVAVDRQATGLLLPVTSRGMLLAVLPSYNIYAVSKTPAPGDAAGGRQPEIPLPLNPTPLTTPIFVDDKIEFGVERCYHVRSLNTAGATAQVAAATLAAAPTGLAGAAAPAISESVPSVVACVTPADTVAPSAPTALAAVASAGAISLIWIGVDAPDLAGYLVLRSSTPDGPLTPLFPTPIRETTYRDTNVRPGARYLYAVVAVDKALPANRSPMSNIASETAR